MLIGDNWKIETDTLNFILYHKTIKQETNGKGRKTKPENVGKESWNVAGYFSNAKSALKRMVDLEIFGDGLKDFEKVCAKIDELKTTIDNIPAITPEYRPTILQ